MLSSVWKCNYLASAVTYVLSLSTFQMAERQSSKATLRCSLAQSHSALITQMSIFSLSSSPFHHTHLNRSRLLVLVMSVGVGIIKAFLGACLSSIVEASEVKWRQHVHHCNIAVLLQQGPAETGSCLHRNLHYTVICSQQLQIQEFGSPLSFFLTLCI